MSIRKLVLLSFISVTIAACSSDVFLVHNGNMPSAEKISQISAGQSKAQVAQVLGSPSSVTSFDGNTWIYMSSTLKKVAFFKPQEVNREILAISFNDNNQVVKIAELDETDGRNIKVDTEVTPTPGQKIGFFRKYFGGVGAYMPIAPTSSGDNL